MEPSFFELVWKKISQIPAGRVTTYGEIARSLKKPGAGRAVGNACNKNPNAPKVPCHRVVAFDGTIGGYAYGAKAKIARLQKEKVRVRNGRILDFERVFWRLK